MRKAKESVQAKGCDWAGKNGGVRDLVVFHLLCLTFIFQVSAWVVDFNGLSEQVCYISRRGSTMANTGGLVLHTNTSCWLLERNLCADGVCAICMNRVKFNLKCVQ